MKTKHALSISIFTLLLAGLNCKTLAQTGTQNASSSISINMSATELVPADIIVFNININAEAKSPQDAFNAHKQRETVLASLLKEFNIKESEINFQPIRINKRNNYNNPREDMVQTSQQVSVNFSDFDMYEKIQLTLIENGFDSFNGQFSSSEMDKGKEKALVSAIENAKERAQFIAKKSGVQLGKITTINYSDHQINRPQLTVESDAFRGKSSMMDFAQTVSVTANVSFVFQIIN